ncbi:SDR family NAD(P)-dependent oxidoreductase [Magnetofaba australis]|uniref:Putative MaoC domain protein dehydratase n=1 Tax=Magnetofaba australis IT-1 TaxID=1434232 RepID=A0A1Y2K9G4_9PROT|nr:SDR family NAD(P)-dependent oxidoreductase [Magnetofaba australis]OSM07126.1 putative MaoC domain protein dehydratase [Magnetofaba australis IT-1]
MEIDKPNGFTEQEQRAFARLSGDVNPIHLDAATARRTPFGRPIAHGVHVVLWALEQAMAQWDEASGARWRLQRLRTQFTLPLRVGEPLRLRLNANQPQTCELEVLDRFGQSAMSIHAVFEPAQSALTPPRDDDPPVEQPQDAELATLVGQTVRPPLHLSPSGAAALLPTLSRMLEPAQLAFLAACSAVVGMRAPGLRSLFLKLALEWDAAVDLSDAQGAQYEYGVTGLKMRGSLAAIGVAGAGLRGELLAQRRPEGVEQPAAAELAALLEGNKPFTNCRALVVGGSRGLGEVAAKLLALGGAEALLTSRSSGGSAQKVVEEIQALGGRARAIALDIADPAGLPEQLDGRAPDLLAYFATPPIFVAAPGHFSAQMFRYYTDYYVDGFLNLLDTLAPLGLRGMRILYPSTAALDASRSPELGPYAAAKAAGEQLGLHAQRCWGVRAHMPRWPRLETDQTLSLTWGPAQENPSGAILLQALMHTWGARADSPE